jgi:hypothetical protein
VPATKKAKAGEIILIPLAQAASGDLPVDVALTYVVPAPAAWDFGAQAFAGPKFDLPLTGEGVKWRFYLPEWFEYDDFEGTLTVNEDIVKARRVQAYGISHYEADVRDSNLAAVKEAQVWQKQSETFQERGEQRKARQALWNAYNRSFADPSLNEDARVQLHDLIRQQAVVGLVQRRGQMRQRFAGAPQGKEADLGDRFNKADAERLRSSLNEDDSRNLEKITKRMIETQDAAAGAALHLMINVPLRGRVIEFDRMFQGKENYDMAVRFTAKRAMPAPSRDWAAAGAVALVLTLAGAVRRRRRGAPAEPAESEESAAAEGEE